MLKKDLYSLEQAKPKTGVFFYIKEMQCINKESKQIKWQTVYEADSKIYQIMQQTQKEIQRGNNFSFKKLFELKTSDFF